jgi:dihydroorotate dehydrogenase electron transfer subunit
MTVPSAAVCPAAAAHHASAEIVAHRQVADRTWRIRIDCPALAATALPGQFAMLRIPDRADPLLGRPLAVYDVAVDAAGRPRFVDFLYLVHGRFTTALARVSAGATLAVWGPLGNGFADLVPATGHLLLVAGGIGQTALLALARERLGAACYGPPSRRPSRAGRVTFCWGARHAGMFGDVDDFRAAGCDVHLATLDGSAGSRGTVVDLLHGLMDDGLAGGRGKGGTAPDGAGHAVSHVACCGPAPMMAAVAAWAARHGLGCHVSLEEPMACGVGICFTCVARVRDASGGWDYRRTCVEGPVFDAREIAWDHG